MEIDATDLLFLIYSVTFKKFSARQQTYMKLELAKLFANAELQELDNAELYAVEATESFPIIIKTEYAAEGMEGFNDDTMNMTPGKAKRQNSYY